MALFIFFGVFFLFAGAMFMFFPDDLNRLNEEAKKLINRWIVSIDGHALRMRYGVGLSCILLSLGSFFVAVWFAIIHG